MLMGKRDWGDFTGWHEAVLKSDCLPDRSVNGLLGEGWDPGRPPFSINVQHAQTLNLLSKLLM